MNPNLTELDFMQECYIRGLYRDDRQMTQKYKYFLSGEQGEKVMHDWLLQNLPAHATILHDFWMEYRGLAQVDLLVLLNNIIWIIEVKHYNGYFQYQDNVCTLNGHRMNKDYISQMRNRLLIMEDIIQQSGSDMQLKGTMIFTHEHSEISIPPELTFDTLTLNQAKRYLTNEILPKVTRQKLNILPHLKNFQAQSTFIIPTLNEKDFTFLKKGVYCPVCFSFDLSISDRNIICEECHSKESKQKAMVRQYCCQGVLQHQKPYIASKDIYDLSNKSFGANNLRKRLKHQLPHTVQGKRLCFYNHALPYDKYIKKTSVMND